MIRSLSPVLRALPLGLLLVLAGCDSGTDPGDDGLAGTYTGEATFDFAKGTAIDYGVRLTFDPPGPGEAVSGTVRLDRGPVGGAAAYSATGTFTGTLQGGVALTLAGTAQKSGDGLSIDAVGFVEGDRIRLDRCFVTDFAFGRSDVVSEFVLRR